MGSQKKKRKQKKLFELLITRLTQKGLLSGHKIVLQPSGEIKMSEVLIDFIEPYSEYWETEEELSKLLSLAIEGKTRKIRVWSPHLTKEA